MKPLRVDFAPHGKWAARACVAVSMALLALAVQQGSEAWQLRQSRLLLQRSAMDLEARIEKAKREQAEMTRLAATEPPYWQDLVAAKKIAAFPMDRVFRSIESAQVAGVRVVSLDISAVDGTATADLEYANNAALLGYLEAINAGEPQQRWRLVRAKIEGAGLQGNAAIQSHWHRE